MDEQRTNIEKILAERQKLDEILKTEFTKQITVMFTDIKGSTAFYEQRGDLDGRMLVHRHNEIVLPVIEANKGRLIKTIGDATMSVYNDPADGVRAAVQVEQKLKAYNSGRPAGEQISVRIGLNVGSGIVEEKDVFGDVVNVASRVESLADGGEIMVTEDVYNAVKHHDEFIFRFADAAKVKGKKESLRAYRVVWQEEDLQLGATRKTPQAAAQQRLGLFILEASVVGQNLKVGAHVRTKGVERAVKHYKEMKYSRDKVQEHTAAIIDVLNTANRKGRIGNELLVKLRELGGQLFDLLVTPEIRDALRKSGESHLMLNIDDQLVQVPWELLYDGKEFLCQRFSIGRSVSTRQAVSTVVRALQRPLRIQVLADPRGDLQAAYQEGIAIKEEVGNLPGVVDVSLTTANITLDFVKSRIRNFDIIHYAGHAEHLTDKPEESGWLLRDGKLSAADVGKLAGNRPMPALVFSNACQTGQTEEWKLGGDFGTRIFGLANAFLLTGVQHYIGTFWEIPDEAGALFARSFYRNLAAGSAIGEALRLARHELIRKYGEDTVVWASFMLYGDPTTQYIADAAERAAEAPAAGAVRGTEAAAPAGEEKKWSPALVMGAAGFVVAAGIAAWLLFGRGGGMVPQERPALPDSRPAPQAADAEKNKRIDELVASLAAEYRTGKAVQPKGRVDAWSSRPVTLVFMDVKAEAGGDKAVNLLSLRVAQALESEGRVQMVERELLDKLLAELKLSASSLADPATALRLGKILSARIMVTGSIVPEKKGMTVALRFVDTETTAVRKVLTVDAPKAEIDRDLAQNVARGINEWVREDFPLRGRVLALSGETCRVNLGQAHGLKQGDRLEVVKEAKKGSGLFAVIGELEVTESAKDQSAARIVSTVAPVKDGALVRVKR